MAFVIAGLVLGILSLVGSFVGFAVPFGGLVSLILGIVGLVLSCIGRKRQPGGLGTAALVVSIVAVVFAGIVFLSCGLCAICALGALASEGAAV